MVSEFITTKRIHLHNCSLQHGGNVLVASVPGAPFIQHLGFEGNALPFRNDYVKRSFLKGLVADNCRIHSLALLGGAATSLLNNQALLSLLCQAIARRNGSLRMLDLSDNAISLDLLKQLLASFQEGQLSRLVLRDTVEGTPFDERTSMCQEVRTTVIQATHSRALQVVSRDANHESVDPIAQLLNDLKHGSFPAQIISKKWAYHCLSCIPKTSMRQSNF